MSSIDKFCNSPDLAYKYSSSEHKPITWPIRSTHHSLGLGTAWHNRIPLEAKGFPSGQSKRVCVRPHALRIV